MPAMPADSSRAVFFSYASQDAEVVKRIAEALRAAGVEVWFDQNELVGGDAWDAKIRKQIKECALFVPVISAAGIGVLGCRGQTSVRRGLSLISVEREKYGRAADLGLRDVQNIEGSRAGLRSHPAGGLIGGVNPAPRLQRTILQHFIRYVRQDQSGYRRQIARLESSFVQQSSQRIVQFERAEWRQRQSGRAGPSASVANGGRVIGIRQIQREEKRSIGVFPHRPPSSANSSMSERAVKRSPNWARARAAKSGGVQRFVFFAAVKVPITRPRRVIFTGVFWAADSTAAKSWRSCRRVTVFMLYIRCFTWSGCQAAVGRRNRSA